MEKASDGVKASPLRGGAVSQTLPALSAGLPTLAGTIEYLQDHLLPAIQELPQRLGLTQAATLVRDAPAMLMHHDVSQAMSQQASLADVWANRNQEPVALPSPKPRERSA